MRKCDSCGKVYQESKDVFCPHCGAVAQKECTHSSSFDSKRYDRGEIYKNNEAQYKKTTYSQGFEPHAQRENSYTQPSKSVENRKSFSGKSPTVSFPDLTKKLPNIKNGKNIGKPIGLIIFCVIMAFNLVTGLLSTNDSLDYESATEVLVDESNLYTVVDKATIELVDTDRDFKTFTLELSGMGFDDYLSENMQTDILSGVLAKEILAEDALVDMLICDFSKEIVDEESYNNALTDSAYYTGERTDDICKYEFTYNFNYGDIVHIASGVNFYLDNGVYINAELPFSAFSISENGKITYYTSYADSDTGWKTVFSECSNQQKISRDLFIDFNDVEAE